MISFSRKQKRVTILGSCVSRDTMEYIPRGKWEINLYAARTKVVSQLSVPLNVPECEILLDSQFQKRIVLNDLNKQQFLQLEKEKRDWCIIDYIDERFSLVKISNTFITKSGELVKSEWLRNKVFLETQYMKDSMGNWKIEEKLLEGYMKEFLDKILCLYKRNKIILHKAYMVNEYIDKKGGGQRNFGENIIENNRKINEMLKYMYDFTEKYVKRLKVIDISDKYSADENHKWGLAPMHYQQEYYYEAAKLIRKYMKI